MPLRKLKRNRRKMPRIKITKINSRRVLKRPPSKSKKLPRELTIRLKRKTLRKPSLRLLIKLTKLKMLPKRVLLMLRKPMLKLKERLPRLLLLRNLLLMLLLLPARKLRKLLMELPKKPLRLKELPRRVEKDPVMPLVLRPKLLLPRLRLLLLKQMPPRLRVKLRLLMLRLMPRLLRLMPREMLRLSRPKLKLKLLTPKPIVLLRVKPPPREKLTLLRAIPRVLKPKPRMPRAKLRTPKMMQRTPKLMQRMLRAMPRAPKMMLRTPKPMPKTPKLMQRTPRLMQRMPKQKERERKLKPPKEIKPTLKPEKKVMLKTSEAHQSE